MLWQSDDLFDYEGSFLTLHGLKGTPHPYGGSRPMVLNAGMSDIGKTFAIECCDGLFSTPLKGGFGEFATLVHPVFTSATVTQLTDPSWGRSTPAEWDALIRTLKAAGEIKTDKPASAFYTNDSLK